MKSLKRVNWYLFSTLFIYNILDAWHTKLLLATGAVEEVNPIMNYFIAHYGVESLFVIKIVMFVGLGVLMYYYHKRICMEKKG